MANRYRNDRHPEKNGSLVLKIALGIVLGSIVLWGIRTIVSFGAVFLFVNAIEQSLGLTNPSKLKPMSIPSPFNISPVNLSNSNAIDVLNPLTLPNTMQQVYAQRAQASQKAINEKSKEYHNITSANQLYHQKHPDLPRINTPIPNFLGAGLQANNNINLIANDSSDPHSEPNAWDSVKSKDKICWYHKITKYKVCESN